MDLNFFRKLENDSRDIKDKEIVNDFIEELTKHLNNFKEEMRNNRNKKENVLRQDDCLYQVVDFSSDGVYLQNTDNNKIFEEKNIAKDLKDIISNDYILRYKNGKYIYEEELTKDFFEKMVDINEYKEIREKFIKKTNILKNSSEIRYSILSRGEDITKLKYKYGEIEVPNILLPYFINDKSILYYKNGRFHKDLSDLK